VRKRLAYPPILPHLPLQPGGLAVEEELVALRDLALHWSLIVQHGLPLHQPGGLAVEEEFVAPRGLALHQFLIIHVPFSSLGQRSRV
jgi:hypothetical protein